MNATFNTTASAVQKLAALAVANPSVAIDLLRKQESNADEVLRHLVGFPGAIESLMHFDGTPRWLKGTLEDVLDEAGLRILT